MQTAPSIQLRMEQNPWYVTSLISSGIAFFMCSHGSSVSKIAYDNDCTLGKVCCCLYDNEA